MCAQRCAAPNGLWKPLSVGQHRKRRSVLGRCVLENGDKRAAAQVPAARPGLAVRRRSRPASPGGARPAGRLLLAPTTFWFKTLNHGFSPKREAGRGWRILSFSLGFN